MTARKAAHLVISGRVQGVWYRGWMVDAARARGLDGWVRNRADGTVEAVVAGPQDAVDAMAADCWQGPPDARVADIRARVTSDPGPTGFFERRSD